MNYFAKLVNNVCEQVICLTNDIENGAEWCAEQYGGEWVQTFYDNPNKTAAGTGYTYDYITQNFIAPIGEPCET